MVVRERDGRIFLVTVRRARNRLYVLNLEHLHLSVCWQEVMRNSGFGMLGMGTSVSMPSEHWRRMARSKDYR